MTIEVADRLKEVSSYYFALKLAQIDAMRAEGKQVLNLGIGSPDLSPPRAVIDTLNAASTAATANMYQSYRGLPALRQAFSDWYVRYFSVALDANTEILPLLGSKEGIMHISMTFLQEGDKVLIPNPGYPAYSATAKLAGATQVEYVLEEKLGWLPDLAKLEAQDLTDVKIMWINYPNMPTGAKANKEFFTNLVAFAKRNAILLCHDNPYAFILSDDYLSLLSIPGAMDVCLELNSLSKCYNMAGWRIGCLLGNKTNLDNILRFKSNMDSGMYRPIQEAAIVALQQEDDWFDSINAVYAQRREVAWRIMDLLQCTYDTASVGMFVWGKIPAIRPNGEDFAEELLQNAHVFITPGFIFGSMGDRFLRISLCSDVSALEEAYSRISNSINSEL